MTPEDKRNQQVYAEQVRLLYSTLNLGVGVTLLATSVLSYLQWDAISHRAILCWWAYMVAVSGVRFAIWALYRRAARPDPAIRRWGTAFTIGTALSGTGWGAAGFLLYSEAQLTNQVFLAFVLGGMMLGGASLLAARPEAFVTFLLATGLPTGVHFLLQGDSVHVSMGILSVVFTLSTLITTRQIYRTVTSTLYLRFENHDLVEDLRAAKERAEALNEELELRVRERTAELNQAVLQLKQEMVERERSEQERSKLEVSLRHAQKLEAIGVLAGGIAHDFNNTLTTIAGFTTLARDALPKSSGPRAQLEHVLQAANRAADLVRRLLVFSRRGQNKPVLVPAGESVAEALELLRASLPSCIELRRRIEPRCGHIFADPSLIHQVVINLCTNAYQAMTDSSGRAEVPAPVLEVTLVPVDVGPRFAELSDRLPDGQYVRLTVSDCGRGIPAEIADRVFEPFFTTRKTGQGTGLGLSVVHGVVTGYGGLVTFRSNASGGTTFVIYLPRVAAADSLDNDAPEPLKRATGRILFVDDEAAIVRLATTVLQDLGYTVTPETSSTAALRQFTQSPDFDLLICDFMMPHLNGGELIRSVKQIRPELPVILISGFNDSVMTPDEIAQAGIDEYLRKPFSPAALGQAVQRVLARHVAR